MKKLLIALLTLAMTFALVACGSNESAEQNEIAALFANEEYSASMTSCNEGVWKGIFTKENYTEVKLAVAKMTDDQAAAYDAIDFADDDAEDQQKAIVFAVQDVTITDITDKIPTQDVLDEWIGKKCADLEDAGFYESGNTFDENDPSSLEIFYDGPEYCVAVGFDKSLKLNIDDLSANDIRALTIKSVRMIGLGEGLL